MASSTRQALSAATAALEPKLSAADLTFAAELFAVSSALATSKQLRNLLSDPSAEAGAKAGAVAAVFKESVSNSVVEFVIELSGMRWSRAADLSAAFEQLAVHAVAAIAARSNKLELLETELYEFRAAVDSDSDLQLALGARHISDDIRVALAEKLVSGRYSPEGALLVRQAVIAARRRRVSVVVESFGKQVSAFATRLVATVTVASEISEAQLQRLEAILAKSYGQSLKLNVEVDPGILGGVRVQVAGEIIDGSLERRLSEAKLQLA